MNSLEARMPGKGVLLLLIVAGTAALLVVVAGRIAAERRALDDARNEESAVIQAHQATSNSLVEVRREVGRLKSNLMRFEVEEKAVAAQAKAVSPDNQWTSEPSRPGWEDDSPYVWLRKESIQQLPVHAFGENGGLLPEMASVLRLGPAQAARLNQDLEAILNEYRALEATQAETVDEPLAGINVREPHLTLKVKPFPKEGAELKKRFEGTLRESLGPERAQLVLAVSEGWLDSQFALAGDEPKVISVARHDDGTYNLSVRTGNSWLSTGGFRDLSTYLPPHLLPFFSDDAFKQSQEDGE